MARLSAGANAIVPTISALTGTVGFLILPGFQTLDAAGPIAAFEVAARLHLGAYAARVIAAAAGPVESSSHAIMMAEPLGDAASYDTLVFAGGEGTAEAMQDGAVMAFAKDAARRTRRIASVCSGAYILAAAGLLDGQRATTHWSRSQDFARRYPKVSLEPDRIFIRQGKVWTSAGITAGIDLSLALIAEDLGETTARRTAQQLVVYHRRPGGQSQFSALLEMDQGGEGRFGPLMAWARDRLTEPLSVEQLAAHAAMSPRNFARAFLAETGVTPAKAVERLRLEAAREPVEAHSAPIDRVAEENGFGDPQRMRRAFIRAFRQPPH